MKVLVCGSRSYEDRGSIHAALSLLAGNLPDDEKLIVVNGWAVGADRMADEWCTDNDRGQPWRFPAYWTQCDHSHPEVPCPPDGGRHRRRYNSAARPAGDDYCPLAGVRRNATMLVEAQPEVVLAFTDTPLAMSKGTADMVARARRAGITVLVFGPDAAERGDQP